MTNPTRTMPLLCRLGLHAYRHGYYDTPSKYDPAEPKSPFTLSYWRRECRRCGRKAAPTV